MARRKRAKKTPATGRILLVNATEPEEIRIALVDNDNLDEFYLERKSHSTLVGNVYKGRVENVHMSLQAAFVNIGLEKNSFLHVSETLTPDEEEELLNGRFVTNPSKGRNKIQKVLREGEEILVQVTRDGMMDKGPSVSMDVSLPGRFFVLTPTSPRLAFSKRLDNPEERARIKSCMDDIGKPEGLGFIARTAVEGTNKTELKSDLKYMIRLWNAVAARAKRSKAPSLIYQESDLIIRTIRDVFTKDIDKVIVDDSESFSKVRQFFETILPKHVDRVEHYEESEPIFRKYKVEEQIDNIHAREMSLKSGGSIVIEQTEAMTTIDVNSGSFTSRKDPEKTSTITNMEAAEEIARQLRLRDIGGIIVIDFIDMRAEKNRRDVEKKLREELKRDRSKLSVLRMSRFCLVQIARQKVRSTVRSVAFNTCPTCNGVGVVKTSESMALAVLRELRSMMKREDIVSFEILADSTVARYLEKDRAESLKEISEGSKRAVHVLTIKGQTREAVEILAYSQRGETVERVQL